MTDGEGIIDPRMGRTIISSNITDAQSDRIVNRQPSDASCPVMSDICCLDLDYSPPTDSTPAPSRVKTCVPQRPDATVI